MLDAISVEVNKAEQELKEAIDQYKLFISEGMSFSSNAYIRGVFAYDDCLPQHRQLLEMWTAVEEARARHRKFVQLYTMACELGPPPTF